MTRTPKIPMRAWQVPQQRINLVVGLPERPDGFEFEVGYDCLPAVGSSRRPQPRDADLIVQAEWAETPMNNSISAFYIEGRRHHWILWNRYYDDNNWTPRWRWSAAGYCPRKGVERKAAAVHLLIEYWRHDGSAPGDGGHWINEPGLLSIEEVRAVARAVRTKSDERPRHIEGSLAKLGGSP